MKCCAEVRGAQCHCARCHQTFGNLTQFDAHQEVRYKPSVAISCKAPEALGLLPDSRGTWRTPEALRSSAEKAARMRLAREREAA